MLAIYVVFKVNYTHTGASQVALVVKYSPANAGDGIYPGSIPGSGGFPGGGEHGHTLQYSCLQNVMDRRVWRAMVYRVIKGQM